MKQLIYQFIKVTSMLIALIAFSPAMTGQAVSVTPVTEFYQTYKDKHRIILDAIEARTDLSISAKLILYGEEIGKLKNEFRDARRAEYQSKSVELSVQHSCTSGSSGGVKDCKWKSVSAPNSSMYTRTDWIRVEGTNKGTSVDPDGSSASLRMTVAGKGRNAGTLFALFKYRPEDIVRLVEQESTSMFNQIVQ